MICTALARLRQAGTLAALLFVAATSLHAATAVFKEEDKTTKGDWETKYGKDGAVIFAENAKLPNYAQVNSNGQDYTYESPASREPAPYAVGGDDRFAGCKYGDSMVIELRLTEGAHRVAFFFMDWNTKERAQKIEAIDMDNNKVLDTRDLKDFSDGRYFVYEMSGNVKLQLTKTAGRNACASGVFFGDALRPSGPKVPKPPPGPPTVAGHHKQRFEVTAGDQKFRLPYSLYLPENYFKSEEKYPLMVFMHGAGECGTDLEATFIHGPNNYLRNNPEFRKNFPYIALSPQSIPGRRWDTPGSSTGVVQLIKFIEQTYRVDADHVYITGLSMGGKGTWLVSEEAPELFAAVAPISAVDVEPAKAPGIFKTVPLWIICGGEDGGFTEGSRKMYKSLKEAGNEVQLTVVPKEGHGVWPYFFEDLKFWQWLAQHKRGENKHIPIMERWQGKDK